MATTFLDVLIASLWTLIFMAAAWAIIKKALTDRDEISEVVIVLTKPCISEASDEIGNRTAHHEKASANASGRLGHDPQTQGRSSRGGRETQGPAPVMAARATLRALLPVLLTATIASIFVPAANAARYEFDQRRTEVRFIYTIAFSTQRGRFSAVSGTLDYDEAAPEKSKISASIAATSLSTGEDIVDKELKGADFFNVDASPVIAFRSLAVRPRSENAAEVAGELTVNGITKPVTLNVKVAPHNDPALKHDAGARRFVATTRIKRSAFNMTSYKALVDDDVDLEIEAIARPR